MSKAGGSGDNQFDDKGVLKSVVELLDMTLQYIREQLQVIVYDNLVKPVNGIGKKVLFTVISAVLFGLGALFVLLGIFAVIILFIPKWAAYFLIGFIGLVSGGIVNWIGKSGNGVDKDEKT